MGAEGSWGRSRPRGAKRGADPPIALGPLKEKDKISMPTNGPPMIQSGMNGFITWLLESFGYAIRGYAVTCPTIMWKLPSLNVGLFYWATGGALRFVSTRGIRFDAISQSTKAGGIFRAEKKYQ